ncbi:hypothetical protein MNBD_NITROSPINAE02-1988 [hydrothermal vent metagenome]|uniref:Aspartate/glutamate/uridylate kinase domain-containing protein n=1 Tax=hydrothermal vent metagenome TaxID=652676 RepID=A0A3B1CD82_9ZZZZ
MTEKEKWLLKIGGSLGSDDGQEQGAWLKALIGVIEGRADNFKFVIVPGGGSFADFVRYESDRKNVSAATAHIQATLGVSQYGYRLLDLMKCGAPAHNKADVERIWSENRIPVFIPYPFIVNDKCVPASWNATSDTFAARICQRLGIKKLALLKSVDGIFLGEKLLKEARADSLPDTDVIDHYFIKFLSDDCETHIMNGKKPNHLIALLENKRPSGTRIYK